MQGVSHGGALAAQGVCAKNREQGAVTWGIRVQESECGGGCGLGCGGREGLGRVDDGEKGVGRACEHAAKAGVADGEEGEDAGRCAGAQQRGEAGRAGVHARGDARGRAQVAALAAQGQIQGAPRGVRGGARARAEARHHQLPQIRLQRGRRAVEERRPPAAHLRHARERVRRETVDYRRRQLRWQGRQQVPRATAGGPRRRARRARRGWRGWRG